ncbi:hypothetical protein BGW41_006500 [Actinomortierella wolfii]|nr:hypothetical protein BGW41_006500 [Actinomortierella wolfii]
MLIVDHVREWDAFGYINNQLVAVSPQVNQTRTISLDARGQPAAGSPVGQFDVSAAADFETNSITKMAEYTGRTGDMLKGVIPVPNPNGGAPTWALAYNHRKNGLYGLVLSEEGGKWEEEIQESRRSSVIYGAVGGVAAVIVVILAVFFWRRKRNQKKTNMTDTHDTSHLDENNHPTSVDVNGMTLLAGNSEVKGDDHLPKIEDTPPLPLQQETLSQSQQPQFYPLPQLHPNPQYQPQPQPYTQSYLYAYPQQYPQPGPNLIQPHPQPFSSTTTYTVPITLPTLVPTPAAALTPTTATVVANSAPIEPVQQELQFSSHPRPNVVTTVSGAHP